MTGLLGLIGGREHGAGCEAIDRHLLDAVAHDDPVVAVIPLASSMRTRARTIGRAVGWWDHLGATTVVAGLDRTSTPRLLRRADVLVMTGGVPDRLYRRLLDGGLHTEIVARWRAGAHLVGSSSGAMVLAGVRQSVRPPFGVVPGFGLLPGVAIAPHHELGAPRTLAAWRSRTHPHALIVGIDEATGLVGRDGRFRVLGTGTVVVRRGSWQRTYLAGGTLDLARHGMLDPVGEARRVPVDPTGRGPEVPSRVPALRSVATGDAVAATSR